MKFLVVVMLFLSSCAHYRGTPPTCSDSFTKEYLEFMTVMSDTIRVSLKAAVIDKNKKTFKENLELLKNFYELLKLSDQRCQRIALYGEGYTCKQKSITYDLSELEQYCENIKSSLFKFDLMFKKISKKAKENEEVKKEIKLKV